MSIKSITSISQTQPVIMVGSEEIMEDLHNIASKYLSVSRFALDIEASQKGFWGRDFRVVGAGCIHLIPYSIKDPFLSQRFKSHAAAIGCTSKDFYGTGFQPKHVLAAVDHAKLHKQPYRETLTTIEGGNCYVFFNSKGELKAIVGIHSVILTVIGLEEQGYFTNQVKGLIEQFIKEAAKPSDRGLLLARNADLYKKIAPFDERLERINKENNEMFKEQERARLEEDLCNVFSRGYEDYFRLLSQPVSLSDKKKYYAEGLLWDAKYDVSEVLIAQTLGVASFKDIAFIEQETLHIDMELFIDPSGDTVYVNKNSKKAVANIEKIGCKVETLHGTFSFFKGTFNFMNGFSFRAASGNIFVTNGGDEEYKLIYQMFKEELLKKSAYKDVVFIDGMQRLIEENGGGIHCLTWERQDDTNATPIDHIQNYLIDDRPFQMQIRRNILMQILPLK